MVSREFHVRGYSTTALMTLSKIIKTGIIYVYATIVDTYLRAVTLDFSGLCSNKQMLSVGR